MDLPVLRGDGSLVKTSWTSFWSEEHKTIFSVVHDVSQLKEAERQQREFLELVTIDLRAPLIAASESFAAIVNNKDECKDVLSEIESARSNLERLLAFADDLVDFQRLQIGEMTMHKAEADLCSLVRQSIELLQPLAVEKNLTVSFLPAGEALVRCDELKITKVLTNLLSNAITWSPAGGEIEIALNKASTSLEVSVRDEGPGIPLEFRNSVFEAFEQIPGSSKKQGGTGLGLAICRKIVEAHGGTIGVRKPDEVRFAPQGQGKAGSVFWFTVPLTVTGSPRED
jgi:signal transduction histidine kinase